VTPRDAFGSYYVLLSEFVYLVSVVVVVVVVVVVITDSLRS
jgi:uncharacterized membrane protein